MKTLTRFMLLLGLALAATACEKDSSGTTTTETKTESKTVTGGKTTEIKTQTKVTEVSAKGPIGVAECDDYAKKLEDCAAKSPAGAAGPMRKSLENVETSWRHAAATPEGRSMIAASCKRALEQAKSDYAGLGCNL